MKILLSLALLMGLMAPAFAQTGITPANLTVNAGASFNFEENSTNAVSFQWVFDGTNIDGATNAQYYVDDPVTSQAGVYWVVTSNRDTSISSNSATLTVLQGTIVNFSLSGFAGGSSSNVVVELFDHDKPATSENFVHYIRSGAYSNMFFDRLIPGFVLQGGDYNANDRTNPAPGLNAVNIFQSVVQGNEITDPSIPYQIDSEYNVGPYVSNVKGTLALALPSGNPNGGNSAFFFNLVDNSGPPNFLDYQQFTVFGRVIGGEDILDYFNDTTNFSKLPESEFPTNLLFTSNPFTNGIFDQVFLETNATTLTDLPVNYHGTNIPADSNLFFVDFNFPDPNAQPYIDTTPPTATITFPTANLLVTNGFPLVVQGTASDNVGLAFIECTLYSQNGSYSLPLGEPAAGTTNWSLNVDDTFGSLSPGIYDIAATPQDGAGNLGTTVYQDNVIVTAVLTNGVGTVALTNENTYPAAGSVVADAVGAYMATGSSYALGAQPGANQLFAHWSDNAGDPYSISPDIYFQMSQGYVVTATFISNGIPGSIAFTYPPPQGTANATNGVFSIQGTITGLMNAPVGITCQLFSVDSRQAVDSPMQTYASNNWAFPVTNLANGQYFVQAIAQDVLGRQTLITNSFTVQTLNQLTVVLNGPGTITTNLNGQYLVAGETYSMTAAPAANGIFENWNNNGNVSLTPLESFTMSSNLTLSVTFLSNDIPGAIAFTYPIPGKLANATNGILGIQGTITGLASPPVAISCQLFSSPGASAVGSPLQTSGTTTWSVQTNLPNGQYYVQAIAQDAQGRTTLITNAFTVQTVNQLTVVLNGPGTITTNLNGFYLAPGTSYTMKAKAANKAVFETWSDGVNATLNPVETFTMSSNLVLTATFVSNDIPGAIAFTYPKANAGVTNSALTLAGTTKSSITATQIVCQLFANSNSIAPPTVATNSETTWSVPTGNLLPGQTNLAPGAYTVVATAYNNTGESTLIAESFNILAHLTIATSTNVVVPAILGPNNVNTNIVTVTSPQRLGTISLASSNGGYLIPGASYTISAKPKPGYLFAYWSLNGVTGVPTVDYPDPTQNPAMPFSMTTDGIITANFATNYFPRVTGTYNGIFYPPNDNPSPTNSGYLTMSINNVGSTTIKLSLPGRAQPYSLSGPLPYFCGVYAELPGLDGNGLIVSFAMDLTNFSGAFTGYVYDANYSWYGNLTAYLQATKLTTASPVVPGRYVLTIPGYHNASESQPGGDSFATYSISATGAVALAGSLADNTPFTQSTGVSTNGIWPLYVPLYPNSKSISQGVILGWQTNAAPTNFSGQSEWSKPAVAAKAGTYYDAGFEAQLPTSPTNYTEPAAGTHYQIVFNGATLTEPLTNFLTVSPSHLFTANAGQTGLVVTLNATTGAITGQFKDPANDAIKKINGAFTSPDSGGSGYILDTNGETGYFEVSLLP